MNRVTFSNTHFELEPLDAFVSAPGFC